MRNTKGQQGIGYLIIFAIIVGLAIWAWNGVEDLINDVEIKIDFSDGTIGSGDTTRALVTLTNNKDKPVEASVTVRPAAGSQGYISISTNEDTNVKLGGKDSKQTLGFNVVGTSHITVEPKIDVIVTFKGGKTIVKQATLRVEA